MCRTSIAVLMIIPDIFGRGLVGGTLKSPILVHEAFFWSWMIYRKGKARIYENKNFPCNIDVDMVRCRNLLSPASNYPLNDVILHRMKPYLPTHYNNPTNLQSASVDCHETHVTHYTYRDFKTPLHGTVIFSASYFRANGILMLRISSLCLLFYVEILRCTFTPARKLASTLN